ncbi:MAG: 50S ribosomal protein L18 [Dehalococcoidales bacterium]|nr:50S ribosomal protein L18 [Dehalococcoidales bacterium]
MAQFNRRVSRVRRHTRIRKTLNGTVARPRLAIFRSVAPIYAQVIDDTKGNTLATASSLDAEIKKQAEGKKKGEIAGLVGALVAKRAVEKGISEVAFDRGGFKYHGRVKALGEAARKQGLKF